MKAYIFDLDGTLFESMNVWVKADELFFQKRGISHPADFVDTVLAMNFNEAAVYTKERYNLPETTDEIKAEWLSTAADFYANHVEMKPGAIAFLDELVKRGEKLAVATSLPEELMTPALHKHGIYHIFHAICTAVEVGAGKAKPDIFVLAANKLGVHPEECILFDDLLAAVKSAKEIGMTACGMLDSTSSHHWDEIKRHADFTLTNFEGVQVSDFCKN